MKTSKTKLLITVTLYSTLAIFSGCAITQNITDSMYGSYMGGMDGPDVKGISQVVELEIGDCFEKVLGFLKSGQVQAELLKIDKVNNRILVLVSREPQLGEADEDDLFNQDNADVGIFLSSLGSKITKVEVKSLSSVTADYTAMKLLPQLQGQN